MGDVNWVAWFCTLTVGLVIYVIRAIANAAQGYSEASVATQAARARQLADVQTLSERRALELIVEFPQLGDAEIATLMRDELMNMRSPHQGYYQWSTPETVARIRRTVVLEHIRNQRKAMD